MIRPAILLALTGCRAPAVHEAAPVAPSRPAVVAPVVHPVVAPLITPGPTPVDCKGRDWTGCRVLADEQRSLDPPLAMRLYRVSCEEGDRLRCFDWNTSQPIRERCVAIGFASGCHALAELYRDGIATCPLDLACAEELFAMACAANNPGSCDQRAATTKVREARDRARD